ncbi:MAG: helix-turn-helix transcriptional regulator [Lachnospiraceae bacterium]|nr:helix-turn-helix transcriptional regulator [Lachnospiraceae bacterium]
MADNLTTTEFAIAMLTARGWTYQEISRHMGISANTVKFHMGTVIGKLGIKQKNDLKKYMLR